MRRGWIIWMCLPLAAAAVCINPPFWTAPAAAPAGGPSYADSVLCYRCQSTNDPLPGYTPDSSQWEPAAKGTNALGLSPGTSSEAAWVAVSGTLNKCFWFDGNNDVLYANADRRIGWTNYAGVTKGSVACWVQSEVDDGSYQYLWSLNTYSDSANTYMFPRINYVSDYYDFFCGSNGTACWQFSTPANSSDANVGQWTCIILYTDGQNGMHVKVNDVEQTLTWATTTATNVFVSGIFNRSPTNLTVVVGRSFGDTTYGLDGGEDNWTLVTNYDAAWHTWYYTEGHPTNSPSDINP